MARVVMVVREIPAGTAEQDVEIAILNSAGSQITTVTTDADGRAVWEQDGSPGPISMEGTVGTRTKRRDGLSEDQMGTWFPSDIPQILRLLGNGVIKGYADEETAANDMALSPGTGRKINVASGATLLDGHIFRATATHEKDIAENVSGSTRYDRVVLRFERPRSLDGEGKFTIEVVTGTSDSAGPALTNSATRREYSLGKIRVVNGAASFTTGDITDERYNTTLKQSLIQLNPGAFVGAVSGYVNGDLLVVSNGVLSRLAAGTADQVLKIVGGVPTWSTQTLTVTVQEGDVTVATDVTVLDFDTSDFTISAAGGEAEVSLNYGTGAGQPAEGNHTHDYAAPAHTHDYAATTHNHDATYAPMVHPHVPADVTGLTEYIDDAVNGLLVAGTNVTLTYSDAGDSLTIDVAGGSTSLVVQEGDSTVVTTAGTLDFDATDFNVTNSPTGEANIALAYGTGAGTPAEGNHTHSYSPTDHTHEVTAPIVGSQVVSYTSHAVSTTLTTIDSFQLGPLTSGIVYDVEARCEAMADAPASGYIDLYVRIETGGTNTAGSRGGTASGERPVFAWDHKTITGTGASINIAMRAQTTTGSGAILSGLITAIARPRRVAAS